MLVVLSASKTIPILPVAEDFDPFSFISLDMVYRPHRFLQGIVPTRWHECMYTLALLFGLNSTLNRIPVDIF